MCKLQSGQLPPLTMAPGLCLAAPQKACLRLKSMIPSEYHLQVHVQPQWQNDSQATMAIRIMNRGKGGMGENKSYFKNSNYSGCPWSNEMMDFHNFVTNPCLKTLSFLESLFPFFALFWEPHLTVLGATPGWALRDCSQPCLEEHMQCWNPTPASCMRFMPHFAELLTFLPKNPLSIHLTHHDTPLEDPSPP